MENAFKYQIIDECFLKGSISAFWKVQMLALTLKNIVKHNLKRIYIRLFLICFVSAIFSNTKYHKDNHSCTSLIILQEYYN